MQADPVYGVPFITAAAMWFRSLVLATALVSVSLPTLARGELSDARKWRVLLPTVRAVTDCIARGIAASPTAVNYARQENWLEAVKSTAEECRSFGNRLIAEHDRLYGPGTGKTFVEGPYAADLPRAVKARIGPQIARVAAEPAKAEEETMPDAAVAEMSMQVTAAQPPVESEALEKGDDPAPALEARIGAEVEPEAAQPTAAEKPALPAEAAAEIPVAAPPLPPHGNALERDDLKSSTEAPRNAVVREEAVTDEQRTALVADVQPELTSSAAVVSSPGEERVLRPAPWSIAYTFVLLSSNSVIGQRMAVSLGVELSNRFVDGAVEVIRTVERLMSEVMPLQVAPETLDVVQLRSIFRQPLDGEPVCALGERGAACLAGVDRAVVQDEHEGLDRDA